MKRFLAVIAVSCLFAGCAHSKAPGYVIGGAMAAAGTGMVVHWQTRDCSDRVLADAAGCGIGNDLGTGFGALVLIAGIGVLGLVAVHTSTSSPTARAAASSSSSTEP